MFGWYLMKLITLTPVECIQVNQYSIALHIYVCMYVCMCLPACTFDHYFTWSHLSLESLPTPISSLQTRQDISVNDIHETTISWRSKKVFSLVYKVIFCFNHRLECYLMSLLRTCNTHYMTLCLVTTTLIEPMLI